MRIKKVVHRDGEANSTTMYYALYKDRIPILDGFGNEELEYTVGFSKPVKFKACLSTGQSDSEEQPFGTDVSYDRIISTADTSLPIDENSIIWVKNKPVYNLDGTVNGDSADYKVAALPLDGLNSLRIAIKKVSAKEVDNSSTEEDKTTDSGNGESTGGSSSSGDDGF